MPSPCAGPAPDPLHITADDRERRSGVLDALRGHPDVTVTVAHLELGDYVVDEEVVVERKTLPDLALSIAQGRLFRQAYRLRTAAPGQRVCLLLEGTAADLLARSRMSRESLQGALVTLTVVFDLPILRARSPEETAWLLLTTARQLRRRGRHLPCRYGVRPTTLRQTQLLLLQAVRDIGPIKARALLDAFGSPAAVAAATLDTLAATPGIGPRIAARLHAALTSEFANANSLHQER